MSDCYISSLYQKSGPQELPGKRKADDESTPNIATAKTKTRKYDKEDNEERP